MTGHGTQNSDKRSEMKRRETGGKGWSQISEAEISNVPPEPQKTLMIEYRYASRDESSLAPVLDGLEAELGGRRRTRGQEAGAVDLVPYLLVTATFVANAALRDEIGCDLFDELLQRCQEKYGFSERTHALKNPALIAEVIQEARKKGKSSSTLESIVTKVLTLRTQLAAESAAPVS
jgi:hypothetical protein